jgi:hypothetical protein
LVKITLPAEDLAGRSYQWVLALLTHRHKLGRLIHAASRRLSNTFLQQYGDEIFHGSAAHNAEDLIRLAGWTGDLTPEEARELRWLVAKNRPH